MDHGYTMGFLWAYPEEQGLDSCCIWVSNKFEGFPGSKNKKVRITKRDEQRQIRLECVSLSPFDAEAEELKRIASGPLTDESITRAVELSGILARHWDRQHYRWYVVFPDFVMLDKKLRPLLWKMQAGGLRAIEYAELRKHLKM
ncbi:hypothetical protein [Lawsonella clevelandensis]|uniref:hypothetical protein n=1 Tax=Lawsonella clevelandensis TaxID=1528099 RepID=UPI0023F581B8|nr:hypothetical protein [Lawsonella clevelandensis]